MVAVEIGRRGLGVRGEEVRQLIAFDQQSRAALVGRPRHASEIIGDAPIAYCTALVPSTSRASTPVVCIPLVSLARRSRLMRPRSSWLDGNRDS